MRLKSLVLQGYKTFASRQEFQFSDKITAIVGPNGSGKSNIADSLRWVLGEQSYSLLRGKKTEDMIFAGSESRPRASMASATVVFDNSEGWLPIDFTEVAISRRAYRDGSNEYLLNGQRVRLRDVGDLLARSGLSERTYTIIGQGLVDVALALKAEERRRLFEEAAGIGLYRGRREEALKRLDATRHNLERVQDILAELKPRLRSLERAARRAQEYEQIRSDLRLILRDWYGYHWHRAQRELTQARETAQTQEHELDQARRVYTGLSEKLNASREQIQILRGRTNSWHRQLSQLHAQRETASRELAVIDERSRSIVEQQGRLTTEIARLAEERKLHQERLDSALAEVTESQAEWDEARGQVAKARQSLAEREAERTLLDREAGSVRQALSASNRRRGELEARLSEREAQAQRQEQALQAAIQAADTAETEVRRAQGRLEKVTADQAASEAQRQEMEQSLQAHQQKLAGAEEAHQQLADQLSKAQTESVRLTAQIDVLEQAERALAGYASGTKVLLEAARKASWRSVRGALSSLLDVPADYEMAVSAALGEYLDAVVLTSGEQLDAALESLAGQKGRAAILPADSLAPGAVASPPPVGTDFLGVAADLVGVPPELRPAVDLLLGNTWLARDRQAARKLLAGARLESPSLRVVTLKGEVFYANGPIFAGQEGKSTLGRTRQRRELSEGLARLEKQADVLKDALEQSKQTLAGYRQTGVELQKRLEQARQAAREMAKLCGAEEILLEKARRQSEFQREQRLRLETEIGRNAAEIRDDVTTEIIGLESRIKEQNSRLRELQAALNALSLEEFQAQVAHWNTQAALTERAEGEAQNRQRERKSALDAADQRQAQAAKRSADFAGLIEALIQEKEALRGSEGGVNEQIEALLLLIEPAEDQLDGLEREQLLLEEQENKGRQVLSQSEHRHAQAKIALARRQEALEGLRTRIEDDFGLVAFDYADEISGPTPLPLRGMVEALPRIDQIPADLEENLKRQRAQLRRMGPINPEAQSEHEEVQGRFDFLTVQVADLEDAESGIKEVIAELDVLMQREFRKTFDAVAGEFRQIFTRLFGGGSARLMLTDPDDLTNTGIDIEARLPGRRTQGLSLLSGGERSLTAVALVFSLLKVSPTPFCVLDEVDAMLDEANVGRFRDLLSELSETTQFSIITHNRNTVQAADVIYGITMGRDSASQVVSLKLDEISQIVD